MKIGELAGRAGVNASAIRYYEKIGLLAAPLRSGGQRDYPQSVMDRVLLIRFAGDMGFTLGEIRIFLNGLSDTTPVGPRWEKLAHRKLKELETSIARSLRLRSLLRNLLRCKCASLKICVEQLGLCDDLTHVSRKRHFNRADPRTSNLRFKI